MNRVERITRSIDRYQQSRRPLALGFAVVKKFGDDRAGSLAALVAFYGFLAIFPLLLLLTTALGLAMDRNSPLERAVLRSAVRDFPIIGPELGRAIGPLDATGIALVVGVIVLLWGSLGVTQAGQLAMAEIWNVPGVDRPRLVTRLVRGFGLLVVLAAGVVATTAIASVSALRAGGAAKVAGLAVTLILNCALFLVSFRVLTPRSIPSRSLLPGAALGGAGWSALQVLGAYLVDEWLRHASVVYGYFASVLGLVSWLFLGAQLTLYAAEVNVVVARRLWPRSLVQPPFTDADKRVLDGIALQGARRVEQSVTSTWDERAVRSRGREL